MITNFNEFTNIGVICEGQTEINFIKVLNKKYFNIKNISLKPVSLGGNVSIERVVNFASKLDFNIITTFIDFYGFKNKNQKNVEDIEKKLKEQFNKINSNKNKIFIPYLQLHETEALWFSSIDTIIKVKNADEKQKISLKEIEKNYKTPEDINDSYETAPSKRLEKIFPDYAKIIDGNAIFNNTSLALIKEKCPRFNNWLTEIEQITKK